jgi:tubulin polyglutamylase TTLL9
MDPRGPRPRGSKAVVGGEPRIAKSQAKRSTGAVIKFYTTFSNTIYDVLSSRNWKEVRSESDWDIVWADRDWVYQCFDKIHLEPWQRMNHFRNGRELCRKDLMAKNIKRQRRLLEKENR